MKRFKTNIFNNDGQKAKQTITRFMFFGATIVKNGRVAVKNIGFLTLTGGLQ